MCVCVRDCVSEGPLECMNDLVFIGYVDTVSDRTSSGIYVNGRK